MTTLYTIDDHGEITSGLTAVEAARVLLRDDSCEHEIRLADDVYELWTQQQVSHTPWSKTVIYSFADTATAAEQEVAEKVIASGHWERGELQCRTDQQHADMVRQIEADEAAYG